MSAAPGTPAVAEGAETADPEKKKKKTSFDLQAEHPAEYYGLLAQRLRRGVEVRNHQSFKVLRYSCVPGSALVSWLLSSGVSETRADGAELCLRLVRMQFMIPAGRSLEKERKYDSFRDADGSLYRFAEDDAARGGLLESVRCPTAPLRCGGAWEFAPHTAHNSLALDASLAEDVAAAAAAAAAAPTAAARRECAAAAKGKLQALRRRVAAELSGDAAGWVERGGARAGPAVSRRQKEPRGDFYTLKTDGRVNATPEQFEAEFLDFETRGKWESTFQSAAVVEGLRDLFRVDDAAAAAAARDGQPARTALVKLPSLEAPDVDWATLDLSGRPEGMSIAYGLGRRGKRASVSRLSRELRDLKSLQVSKLREVPLI